MNGWFFLLVILLVLAVSCFCFFFFFFFFLLLFSLFWLYDFMVYGIGMGVMAAVE